MNEGAFELLDLGLEDVTTHLLCANHPELGDVDVIVQRAPFPIGKSLRDLVDAHLQGEKKRLTGYTIIGAEDGERAGVPVVEVAVRFRADGRAYYQKQAHFALSDAWMCLSINTDAGAREACDGWIEGALASLALRSERAAR